jgi:hypothetical protein
MALTARITGVLEALAMMRRAVTVHTRLDKLRRDFAFSALADAIKLTPVRQYGPGGHLRASNQVILADEMITWVNYANYAQFVELGTGRAGGASWTPFLPEEQGPAYALAWPGMAQMPFLRPAVARELKELEARITALGPEVG